jgi:hypothetical protein
LPHGYGCVAIENVNDIDLLAERLAAIVKDPLPAVAVGARGYAFARALQSENVFPQALEAILESAASRHEIPRATSTVEEETSGSDDECRFPFTRLARAALVGRAPERRSKADGSVIDLMEARGVLAAVERSVQNGGFGLASIASAVRVEVAIAAAESIPVHSGDDEDLDPLFTLQIKRWALDDEDFSSLLPVRDHRLRVLAFDYDVSEFRGVLDAKELPAEPTRRPSYLAVFAGEHRERTPLLVDRATDPGTAEERGWIAGGAGQFRVDRNPFHRRFGAPAPSRSEANEMIRRNFLTLLGGLALWPLTTRAKQPAMPVIGFLNSGSSARFENFVAAYRQGLSDEGYVEGSSVRIDYRWAEGHYGDLDALAAEFVRNRVALIAATGGVVSARAALKATATIPIVFVVGFDPVALGLVASLNKPGGNATGVSIL